jgi:hypothetical protein
MDLFPCFQKVNELFGAAMRLFCGFTQWFQADVTGCGFVVANDQCVMRAAGVGFFHLRFEATAAAV